MNKRESELIFSSLQNAPSSGKGLLALSSETGIGYTQLKEILQSNREYFVRVGFSPNYRVNPFGSYRGNTQKMLEAIENRNQQVKAATASFTVLGYFVLLTAVILMVGSSKDIISAIIEILNT